MLEEKSNYTLEEMDRLSLFHLLDLYRYPTPRNGPLIVERGLGGRHLGPQRGAN